MQILADLLLVFAAIAATYGAARLWSLYMPYVEVPSMSQSNDGRAAPRLARGFDDTYEDLGCDQSLSACCGGETFEIAFELNGRTVNPDEMAHALGKSVLGTIRESVRRRAAAVRCPEHGSAARLLVSGTSLGNLSWEAPGSCPALLAALKNTLEQPN